MKTEKAKKFPHVIRFGIASFDHLFAANTPSGPEIPSAPFGFRIPKTAKTSTSVCLVGPDGTGKSVFALHLTSAYAHDCLRWTAHCEAEPKDFPQILYVSTDLQFGMADSAWTNFRLESPKTRKPPFVSSSHVPKDGGAGDWHVKFGEVAPTDLGRVLLQPSLSGDHRTASVQFVDLASKSSGDDWGFLHSILAALPMPTTDDSPRHLIVVDAIEGFEAMTGERNAYGEETSRRARIAHLMRLAAGKCHLVVVVEQPKDGERLAEEFVADAVIRFRADRTEHYAARTVEIVKARAQAHVRGAHQFVIRGGEGSTTGSQENADDPIVGHSYVHVFHSLHFVNRHLMLKRQSQSRIGATDRQLAGFGIEFLDEMLGDDRAAKHGGLVPGLATSLIGDPGTEKTELGIAFLADALRPILAELLDTTGGIKADKQPPLAAVQQWMKLRNALTLGGQVDLKDLRAKYERQAILSGIHPPTGGAYTNDQLSRHLIVLLAKICALDKIQIPVLITSQDFTVDSLVERFKPWLAIPSEAFEEIRPLIQAMTLCRRMEIHHMGASAVFHVIRHNLEEAQSILAGGTLDEIEEKRQGYSWRIRLVIDDLRNIQNTYPDIGNDPIFLPSVVLHLETEGVTTLIIETHPARLDSPVLDSFETKLRALVQRHIYTWQVQFNGERRVSISVAPAQPGTPTLVRELARGIANRAGKPNTPLYVDPHFELYTGLEEGRPRRVPVEVRLFAETSAFKEYIQDTNVLFSDVFVPLSGAGEGVQPVVIGVPTAGYEHLRDLCNLQREAYLDHTLVFQVDEFWGLQKVSALREQTRYLNEVTNSEGLPRPMSDPYSLFQPTKRHAIGSTYRRKDLFQLGGLALNPQDRIFRVPFTWDFGFLMLKSRAWSNLTDRVPNALKVLGPDLKVSDVWDATRRVDEPQPEDGPTGESTRRNRSDRDELRAPVVPSGGHLSNWSWRAFFGACRVVASREARRLSCPIPVFDVSMIAPQSLSCLVLEIWMSEILTELFVKSTSEKSTPSNQKELEKFLVTFHNSWDQKREFGLDQLAKKYKKALERALLLIAGAIDLRTIFDPDKPFGFRSRGASLSAVASRHWYKTAVEFQGQMPTEEPLTPACLPGHYSTRGDWYLAALKNGRSSRLADRVLDVLNSRRANMTRLQAGLGLPVRDLLPFENDREKWGFRTRLLTESDGRRQGVPLDRLCQLVPMMQGDSFYRAGYCMRWLWRSDLTDFDRHSVIWTKWLARILRSVQSYTDQGRDSYLRNFAIYDYLVQGDVMGNFNPEIKDEAVQWGALPINQLDLSSVADAYKTREETKFDELVEFLVADLEHSCLRDG